MSSRTNRRAALSFLLLFAMAILVAAYLNSALTTANTTTTTITSGSYTSFVNPFIGTGANGNYGGGDTFPGAAYPMGMVQWSPDTISNPPGGYSYYDKEIKGLSLTHFSGRGCNVYQDFPFMPYVGNFSSSPVTHPAVYYSAFSHASESALPGYYEVHLDSPNVTAQLSVTLHTDMGQFTYPASNFSTVIINAGGSVNGNTNSSISIIPSSNEVTGAAQSIVGCGSEKYNVYFAARFDRSFGSFGTWVEESIHAYAPTAMGQHSGAYVVFNTNSNRVVRVQVGISFVSVANAQLNLDSEFAHFDLNSVARSADAAWNAVLGSIQVQGGTPDELTTFYTALYHAFFHPNIFNDVNGQYLGFDMRVHTVAAGHAQYENIAGWDQYRSLIRLLAILKPAVASDISQSLVNDAEQGDSHLPRWEQANVDSHGMSGDSGPALIAEGYAFGAKSFDSAAALNAMVNGQSEIREGFASYERLGYVPSNYSYSASATLEYANDDFAIAQFAQALGDTGDYTTFLQRSNNWVNVFNNSSGYVQPRNPDGSWVQGFQPTSMNGFIEGDSSQYSWMVPYNLHGLFSAMGGNSKVVSHLDTFFTKLNEGPTSPYMWIGNEPSFEVPWEYDFAQAPAHTQAVVREIETQLFGNSPEGLPGNDDGGATSSWYIFAAMGIYPEITGVGGFVIGSPLFSSIEVQLSAGHTLQIHALQAADANPYVQSLELNGTPMNSVWLPWSAVENGTTLTFTLGNHSSSWGSAASDAPPSYPPNS